MTKLFPKRCHECGESMSLMTIPIEYTWYISCINYEVVIRNLGGKQYICIGCSVDARNRPYDDIYRTGYEDGYRKGYEERTD